MANLNQVTLVGNLTRDPELKYIPSGAAICRMNLAVNTEWMKNNEKHKEVLFIQVNVWGKSGEACAAHLKKGSPALVCGRLVSRSWEADDGSKRYATEVTADRIQFLGGKPAGEQSGRWTGGREPEHGESGGGNF